MTSPETLIGKAAGHYASGNLKGAATLCRRVLKARPRHPEALHLLGVVTYKIGDPKRAARYLRDALSLNPSDSEIRRNLAFAQRDLGDLEGAAEGFRRAISLNPNDIISHFQLGVLLGDREQHDAAIPHFDAVLRGDTRNGQALYNRGKALLAVGQFMDAESDFAQAAAVLPEDYRVFAGWGAALHQLERYEAAEEKYLTALEKGPTNKAAADLFVSLGDTYVEGGLFAKASEQYENVRGRDPGNADAAAGLAAVYERERDYQRSHELIRPFLEEDPPKVPVAIAFAKVAPRFGRSDQAIERLQAALAQDSLRPHQRRRLHFALGKLRDSAGDYGAAFKDYRTANELYGGPHNPSAHAKVTDQKIEALDHAEAARLRLPKAPSNRPVFILGMPRSGTSLVEQILASHPSVSGGGELVALPNIIRELPGQLGTATDYRSLIDRIDTGTVERASHIYLDALKAVDPAAERVTDKMPHNFEHLWMIAAAFPGTPIIHCTRHPMDTCLSCYFQDFGGRQAYSRDLTHLGLHYADYRRLMGHWLNTLDLNILEVPYEDMVGDTEALSRNIVAFCGLEWDSACLKFYENRRFVATASYDQVRRPVYSQSVGRYRHYEPYIGDLKNTLQVAAI